MRFIIFLSVFLQIPVKINSKIKGKFLLILQSLTFLPIKISSVDVHKKIFRLISDKSWFLKKTSIDLDLKIKLFIKCFVKTTCSWVENQSSKITNNWFFFVKFRVIVVLCPCPIEHVFDCTLPWIENRIEWSFFFLLLTLNDSWPLFLKVEQILLLNRLIMIFGINQTFT